MMILRHLVHQGSTRHAALSRAEPVLRSFEESQEAAWLLLASHPPLGERRGHLGQGMPVQWAIFSPVMNGKPQRFVRIVYESDQVLLGVQREVGLEIAESRSEWNEYIKAGYTLIGWTLAASRSEWKYPK